MSNYDIYNNPLAPNLNTAAVDWSFLEYLILVLGILLFLYILLLVARIFLRTWHYSSPEWRNL
ncbi:MAG: hypothetical protein CO133_01055, partial [Candidatus Komeilibacteria bacterium CG_4_9_14_3_um_filter_37_5]